MRPMLADNRGLRTTLDVSRQAIAHLAARPLSEWPEHVRSHTLGRMRDLYRLLDEGREEALRRHAAGETGDPQRLIRLAASVAEEALRSAIDAISACPACSSRSGSDLIILAAAHQGVLQLAETMGPPDRPLS